MRASQIDIVADFYHELSIKSTTRTMRGTSSRLLFGIDDIIRDNMMDSLKNDQFKTDLNASFADPAIIHAWSWSKDFCFRAN